jgi:hypothetical protein
MQFLVIGSVTNPHRVGDVGDLDLVVPEFTDNRVYTAAVSLEPYEKLAEATGKPIDLKFSTRPSELNLLGWYEPGGRWQFSWTFCGKDWFTHMKSMTFGEIVDAVRIKPIAGG